MAQTLIPRNKAAVVWHFCLPCDASNSEHQAEKPPSPLIGTHIRVTTGGGGWWIVRRLLEKRADSGVLKRAMLSVETPKRARSSVLTKSFFSDCTATGPLGSWFVSPEVNATLGPPAINHSRLSTHQPIWCTASKEPCHFRCHRERLYQIRVPVTWTVVSMLCISPDLQSISSQPGESGDRGISCEVNGLDRSA